MRKSTILLLALLVFVIWHQKGGHFGIKGPSVSFAGSAPKGMAAPDQPIQNKADSNSPINKKGYVITPLYSYSVKALVLSKKGYGDRSSDLAPYDLALGWGPLSSKYTLDHMKISQSGRWYHYRYDAEFPMSPRKIIHNSANTHIIPADKAVLKALKDVKKYDTVSMQGYLVSVRKPDGSFTWKSSTSRTDSGDGSCELFYVTSLTIE